MTVNFHASLKIQNSERKGHRLQWEDCYYNYKEMKSVMDIELRLLNIPLVGCALSGGYLTTFVQYPAYLTRYFAEVIMSFRAVVCHLVCC